MRSGLHAKLQPEERNLRVYGNGSQAVVSKFEGSIECHGQKVVENILVTEGEGRCLLGSSAAKRPQVLKIGPELVGVYSIGT